MRMSPSAPTMRMGGGPSFARGAQMRGPAFARGMRMPGPGFGPGIRVRGSRFAPGRRMGGPGFGPVVPPVRRIPARLGGRHFVLVQPPFVHRGFGSGHHFRHAFFFGDRCFNDPFFDPFFCRQFFIESGFFGAPFFTTPFFTTPFFAPPIFSSSEPVAQQTGPSQAEVEQGSDLENRVESLTEEVSRLRDESAERPAPAPAPSPAPSISELPASTVLVFRDGHRETVHNYAVAGKTLWVFTEYRAKKVSTSELDLAATKKVNSERGVEFLLPGLR
jgi:hypothetical protein